MLRLYRFLFGPRDVNAALGVFGKAAADLSYVAERHSCLVDKHALAAAKHEALKNASNAEARRAAILSGKLSELLNATTSVADTTSLPVE